MNELLLPPLLREGDRVRVVAPSGAFDRHRFSTGESLLRHAGLVPVYHERIFSRHRYLAGPDEARLAELREALADPEAKAIWIARGGYGATRLLPGIIREDVVTHPKWLIGFSDTSALHARWQKEGLVTMHGPNVTTLDSWGHDARQALWSWLFRGAGEPLRGRPTEGGVVEGTLWGGNLTVLAAMAGGGHLPRFQQSILLLEDIGERPYRLDRSFTALVQAGAFQGVVGVALGQLTACEEREAPYGPAEVLRERITQELGVAVVEGFELGHDPTSWAVPLGLRAVLDPGAGTLSVRMGGVA